MAIKKMKWKDLTDKILPSRLSASLTSVDSLISQVNADQAELFGCSNLSTIYNEVKIILNQDNNIDSMWKDLIIYTSSFKENDCRFTQLILQKIMEYASFYDKILSDNGVQRALVYSKSYENDGNSSTVNRNTESVTPQNPNLYNADEETANTLFDQAIADYASSINKAKDSSNSHTEGESTTNVTGVTWDEQKKNLQMLFYNELCDYLISIPERIYNHYSLDTIPALELTKLFFEHINEVVNMFQSDE